MEINNLNTPKKSVSVNKADFSKFIEYKINSDLMEIFLCSLKFYAYLRIFVNYGFLVGLIILYVYDILSKYILNKFFHLHKLCTEELFLLGFSKSERTNMICAFFFEKNFNSIEIKDLLINKGIKMNEKLRRKIVRKYGIYFWEDVDMQTAERSVKIINNVFESKDDIVDYIRKEIDNHVDILNNVPYEFQIIPYKNKEGGAILFKLDHVLSDGLGIVSFTITLADNFNESLMPDILKKLKIPFHLELAAFLINLFLFPYYSSKLLLNGIINKLEDTPFSSLDKQSGVTSFAFTKNFDFKTLHKINKKLNITFNDLMLAIMSSAINRYVNDFFPDRKYSYKKLNVAIPIGVKNTPKSTSEVQMQIDILGAITVLKRIDDPLKYYDLISKETRYTIKNHYNTSASRYLFSLCNQFLPYSIHRKMVKHVANTVDLSISNLPGPRREMSYCNSKLEEIIPFISMGIGKAFIIIGTYNGKVRIITNVDAALKINVEMLTKYIEDEINTVIESVSA